MLIRREGPLRKCFGPNIAVTNMEDGDYYDADTFAYQFSIGGGKVSTEHDIRNYRRALLKKEAEICRKRWTEMKVDYNDKGIGVRVAPDIWENCYLVQEEQGGDCTGCNLCCIFGQGRFVIHAAEFLNMPSPPRRFNRWTDQCPWSIKEGCACYSKRPALCRIFHCKNMTPVSDDQYKQYLAACYKDGAVVVNSAVRGVGCAEIMPNIGKNWKLL